MPAMFRGAPGRTRTCNETAFEAAASTVPPPGRRWCARGDSNPHSEEPVPETGASTVSPPAQTLVDHRIKCRGHFAAKSKAWCHRRASSARPRPYQGRALRLSYGGETRGARSPGFTDHSRARPIRGGARYLHGSARLAAAPHLENWCQQQGLSLRASPYDGAALHLSYAGMVPAERIKLPTFALQKRCSIAELRRRISHQQTPPGNHRLPLH